MAYLEKEVFWIVLGSVKICQDHQCLNAASKASWCGLMRCSMLIQIHALIWADAWIALEPIWNQWQQTAEAVTYLHGFRLSGSANLCLTLPLFLLYRFVWGHAKQNNHRCNCSNPHFPITHADTFCLSLSTRSTLLRVEICVAKLYRLPEFPRQVVKDEGKLSFWIEKDHKVRRAAQKGVVSRTRKGNEMEWRSELSPEGRCETKMCFSDFSVQATDGKVVKELHNLRTILSNLTMLDKPCQSVTKNISDWFRLSFSSGGYVRNMLMLALSCTSGWAANHRSWAWRSCGRVFILSQ